MTNFNEEYEKRLRRVAGVTDDGLSVEIVLDVSEGYWDGYCETCEYWNEGKPFARVRVFDPEERYTEVAKIDFEDMGELIRALDAVEL